MSRAQPEPGISLEEQCAAVKSAISIQGPDILNVEHTYLRAILASLQKLQRAVAIAREQAEDEGLWFQAEYASEAYLQQALRKIHAEIEGGAATASTAFAEI